MLGGQQVEPQSIVRAAVDVMTLALPANQPEVDASGNVNRWVVFDDPGVNGTEAELGESQGQHSGRGAAGIPLAAVCAIAEHDPDIGSLEMWVDVAQSDDTNRDVVDVGRENSQHIGASLHRNLQPLGTDELPPVTEVEPLIVLFLCQPLGDQSKEMRRVNRLELHEC